MGIIDTCIRNPHKIMELLINSLTQCKNAVSTLQAHWRYCSLALIHRYNNVYYSISMFPSQLNHFSNRGPFKYGHDPKRLTYTFQYATWPAWRNYEHRFICRPQYWCYVLQPDSPWQNLCSFPYMHWRQPRGFILNHRWSSVGHGWVITWKTM